MRTCDDCKATMRQGYVIDAGVKYLCETCHPKHYTPEEWAVEYADGESESYWTEWEEDDGGACRECGEEGRKADRPVRDDSLCWDCYRHIYGEDE